MSFVIIYRYLKKSYIQRESQLTNEPSQTAVKQIDMREHNKRNIDNDSLHKQSSSYIAKKQNG
jgi:hypothetical protein